MVVYLDTNVYIAAEYKFDSGKMAILRDLVNSDKVTVLYTNATEGEVIKHIEKDVKENVTQYNHAVRKNLSALNEDKICEIQELKSETIVIDVIDKFNKFLKLKNVKEISLNPLDAEKLFEDYFAVNPPFEIKKPYEFKDAIMINAVKNYKKKIDEPICIVSSDKGFRSAFSKDNNYVVFEFLGEFLKYYSEKFEEEKIRRSIENAIKYGNFEEEFKKYFYACDIWIDCYEQWDIEDVEILDIVSELLYVERKEEKIYAIISNEVEILIDIEYRDEENSYYDREEKIYLIENFVYAKEKHKVRHDIRICCNITNDDKQKYVLENFEITDDYKKYSNINLDEDTLISKEIINKIDDSDSVYEYCSCCGKLIPYDSIHQDYDGNVVCSGCKKTDKI